MNEYFALSQLKARTDQSSSTTWDTELAEMAEQASREVDRLCNRRFYVRTEARIFDSRAAEELLLHGDLLTVSALGVDTSGDGDFDDESWVEGTDYRLLPHNGWPKSALELAADGNFGWPFGRRAIQITGEWGYGDGESAAPVKDSGITASFSTAATASGTASASGIRAGSTYLFGTEQIWIGAVAGTALTLCERGVNGTTAITQLSVAAKLYQYPRTIEKVALLIAVEAFNERGNPDKASERVGDHSWSRRHVAAGNAIQTMLAAYKLRRV